MIERERDNKSQPNYGIEYKGNVIKLGNCWPDICKNINKEVT